MNKLENQSVDWFVCSFIDWFR